MTHEEKKKKRKKHVYSNTGYRRSVSWDVKISLIEYRRSASLDTGDQPHSLKDVSLLGYRRAES